MSIAARVLFFPIALAMLGACSVQSYKAPISTFSSAVAGAETAIKSLDTELTELYTEKLEKDLNAGELFVGKSEGGCSISSTKSCQIVLKKTRNDKGEPYPPEPVLGNFVRLMVGVNNYAKNLALIVDADTVEQVQESVDKTLASTKNLAASLDGVDQGARANAIAAYTKPVSMAANWLVGSYVRKVQLDALQHATLQADPVIRLIPGQMKDLHKAASGPMNRELVEKFNAAQKAYDDLQGQTVSASERLQKLNALTTAAKNLDAATKADPGAIFRAMAAAHKDLTKALNDPDLTMIDALTKIEEFSVQVAALSEVYDEFAKAREKLESN